MIKSHSGSFNYEQHEKEVRSGTFTKKTYESKEHRQTIETGKKTTVEKHGWKRKSKALYEIIDEGEHVYIIVNEKRYELFEGEYCWYYIDEEGVKHYVGFESKREWVGKGT